MAVCKFCEQRFTWGQMDGKWVPLIPIGEEGDLERTHVDSDGVLRSLHRAICDGGVAAVQIKKLHTPVAASMVLPLPPLAMKKEPGKKTHTKHPSREAALQVPCPSCGADANRPCTSTKGKKRWALHGSRWFNFPEEAKSSTN